jgi:hypothetical protein
MMLVAGVGIAAFKAGLQGWMSVNGINDGAKKEK